jgi:hypothetical protein
MDRELYFVCGLVVFAGALFASRRVRFDIVASLVLALAFSGVLPPKRPSRVLAAR